jgi:hypothetical protein
MAFVCHRSAPSESGQVDSSDRLMAAKYILAALSALFLVLAAWRLAGGTAASHPQARTWLIIGVIFALVSAWLLYQG